MKWIEVEQGRCRITYAADIPGGVLVLVDFHDGNGHAGSMTFVPGIKATDLSSGAPSSETPTRREYSS